MTPSRMLRSASSSAFLILLSGFVWALFLASAGHAATVTLPDFTELAELQGRAVVNISTTQARQAPTTVPDS